jgi:mannose-6-phosphate isomerase-like protein (cupin superfamily)
MEQVNMMQAPTDAASQDAEPVKGEILVVQPEDEESYWQPQPANGHVSVCVAPHRVRMDQPVAVGTQTIPPGAYVREHSHGNNEEVLHFISGTGKTVIDDVEYNVAKGTTLFLGKHRRHTFINDGEVDLSFVWFMTPNGLENFFPQIGRPRTMGQQPPEPFPRPADVAAIEARTVFAPKR